MKKIIGIKFTVTALLLVCSLNLSAKSSGNEQVVNPKRILVVGLDDNIKSNYYYNELIANGAGIDEDKLNTAYNNVIAENISEFSDKTGNCTFVSGINMEGIEPVIAKINVNGEDEKCKADLSSVKDGDLQKILNQADADYLLIINRHFIKKQEKPFNTIFHFISYTVVDSDKNEIVSGNNYSTSIDIESLKQLKKNSTKSSIKLAESISKALGKTELVSSKEKERGNLVSSILP